MCCEYQASDICEMQHLLHSELLVLLETLRLLLAWDRRLKQQPPKESFVAPLHWAVSLYNVVGSAWQLCHR